MLDPDHPQYRRAFGNRYGKGIYVSNSFHYALRYAKPSLLVVAIVEGDHKSFTHQEARDACFQANSRVPEAIKFNSISVGPEIVLQSNSQVLPLFVVTCDQIDRSLNGFDCYSSHEESPQRLSHTSLPATVADVPMFNFAEILVVHLPLARKLKNMFPNVALGVLLHLSAQASLHPQPHNWAVDQLTNYDFDDF